MSLNPSDVIRSVLAKAMFPWVPESDGLERRMLRNWRLFAIALIVLSLLPSSCPVGNRLLADQIFLASVAFLAPGKHGEGGAQVWCLRATQIFLSLLIGMGTTCFIQMEYLVGAIWVGYLPDISWMAAGRSILGVSIGVAGALLWTGSYEKTGDSGIQS